MHTRLARADVPVEATWKLDDLFVDPDCRGHKVGEQLIGHVAEVARNRGWATVRWLTADDNYRARTLYDRVGRKSHFNLYELVP